MKSIKLLQHIRSLTTDRKERLSSFKNLLDEKSPKNVIFEQMTHFTMVARFEGNICYFSPKDVELYKYLLEENNITFNFLKSEKF